VVPATAARTPAHAFQVPVGRRSSIVAAGCRVGVGPAVGSIDAEAGSPATEGAGVESAAVDVGAAEGSAPELCDPPHPPSVATSPIPATKRILRCIGPVWAPDHTAATGTNLTIRHIDPSTMRRPHCPSVGSCGSC
jgi:hypothetical protein